MTDREPQPGDGPEYHADHSAWRERTGLVGVVSPPPGVTSDGVRELADWWRARCEEEIEAVVPKAVEYGANSMIEVGRSMLRVAGRTDVTDEEAIEVACMFYLSGKLGRWIDAVAAGKRPSDDTVYDMGIYIKMAQRARDVGTWPGVNLG